MHANCHVEGCHTSQARPFKSPSRALRRLRMHLKPCLRISAMCRTPFEPALLEASKALETEAAKRRSGEAAKRRSGEAKRLSWSEVRPAESECSCSNCTGRGSKRPGFSRGPSRVCQSAAVGVVCVSLVQGLLGLRNQQKPTETLSKTWGTEAGSQHNIRDSANPGSLGWHLLLQRISFVRQRFQVPVQRVTNAKKRGLQAQQLRCPFRQLFLPATQLAVVARARKRFGRPPVLCRRSTLLNSICMAETRPCASQATPLIDTPACFRSDRRVQCTCFRCHLRCHFFPKHCWKRIGGGCITCACFCSR